VKRKEVFVRILCCLNGTNAEQIGKALEVFSAVQPLTVGMLHVIDTRPRKDIDLIRERFLRPPMHPPHHAPPPIHPPHHIPREEEMSEAERASAQEILNEGRRYLASAETFEIVNLAAEWRADLVVVSSRAVYRERREIGPKSVGHVARFVVDHAPCPVLLLRPLAREQFPIDR
jgi:nucleotide-binding universal stress UspA family protein